MIPLILTTFRSLHRSISNDGLTMSHHNMMIHNENLMPGDMKQEMLYMPELNPNIYQNTTEAFSYPEYSMKTRKKEGNGIDSKYAWTHEEVSPVYFSCS